MNYCDVSDKSRKFEHALIMKKLFFIFLLLGSISNAQSTDTIRVMSYNLLKFPQVNSARISDLEIIVQEALPDIFIVCELTSSSGSNAILNDALNQNGINYYSAATYVPGPDTENMLYYNTNKFGLVEQNVIPTALRDINEYVLYYKSDDIATTSDTTFFYVYMCHLKASQGFETQRNDEISELKSYMATRSGIENVILGGDFNMYGSSEPAWNTILNIDYPLVDPINTPGEWHADWGYEDVHTQSTRTTSIDGGAGGGMDDRFDFIFMSADLMNWGNQAKMIDGTYWAYGQDGNHYNDDLIAAPTNTTLPAAVIQALYDMSDHLPVYAEIEVQKEFNGISDQEQGIYAYHNRDEQTIHFDLSKDLQLGQIEVYDLSGKVVLTLTELPDNGQINVQHLLPGMYILKESNYGYSLKFVR